MAATCTGCGGPIKFHATRRGDGVYHAQCDPTLQEEKAQNGRLETHRRYPSLTANQEVGA